MSYPVKYRERTIEYREEGISQKMIRQKFHPNELVYARGYALIMENNQSIQIAQGYVVHLFREEMLLYHSERKYEYIGYQ